MIRDKSEQYFFQQDESFPCETLLVTNTQIYCDMHNYLYLCIYTLYIHLIDLGGLRVECFAKELRPQHGCTGYGSDSLSSRSKSEALTTSLSTLIKKYICGCNEWKLVFLTLSSKVWPFCSKYFFFFFCQDIKAKRFDSGAGFVASAAAVQLSDFTFRDDLCGSL